MKKQSWVAGALILLGAAMGLSQSALATGQTPSATTSTQSPSGPHPQGTKLRKLADYLELTDQQKSQIKTVMQGAVQQVKALRNDNTLTPAARKAKIADIRKGTRQQIIQMLTPEQKEKLAKLRAHRQNAGA